MNLTKDTATENPFFQTATNTKGFIRMESDTDLVFTSNASIII